MQFSVLIILAILTSVSCLASPVAVFEPGRSSGVEVAQCEDGQWIARSAAGRDAVALKKGTTPESNYLYFKLAPEVRAKLGAQVYLVVDFLDEGAGSVGVQFNSESNSYEGATGFIVLGTGEWQRALVSLSGAKPRGLQNGGADFRFSCFGPLTISRVEVHSEKPDVSIPTNAERMKKSMNTAAQPKDMFYTFGCEIDENSAALYRSLGVTSIESYVTWETCERAGEGLWNWSAWDKTVKILKENDLKWVPFLILSPAYSTPDWFRASHYHFPCRCLEHGTDSKIESLWNPNLPKWVDRFISEFAKRYKDSGVIESVLLGIQGDFGEAIYSVSGGGWTFNVPGEYHNHAGFWCDDQYALADFRDYVKQRYADAAAVNKAWGTSYSSLGAVDFPGRKDELAAFRASVKSGRPEVRRRWLDFVDWYRFAMTNWSDYWIETTRKHFPKTPIYLCTGGDAPPEHGSNFAEQCRVAAKYGAGVRITNEASNYASNFVITRWVAAAGKHYGAYYGFEPAGAEDEVGIVARIYNATASGANQLHDYSPNVVNSPERIEAQRSHLKYLFHTKPIVPVALWYPNVSMALNWGGYLEKATRFRDYADFDYVDESMLATDALAKYKVLVIIHGSVMETADARRIAEWVRSGGRVVVMDVPKLESVEGTSEPETMLFGDSPAGRKILKGKIERVEGWEALASALGSTLKDLGLPVYDLKKDDIYGTQIGPNRFLFLNKGDEATVEISAGKKTTTAKLAGHTITEVKL